MASLLPVFGAIGGSLGSVLTAGSAVVGAVSAVGQGIAASNAAKYNAAVQRNQAEAETLQSVAKATEVATRTRQKVASTRAAFAQNGFEISGSPLDIVNAVAQQGELEQLTALYDGSQRARGLRASAELNDYQAKNAMTAGYIGAGTSILSGASKLYTS